VPRPDCPPQYALDQFPGWRLQIDDEVGRWCLRSQLREDLLIELQLVVGQRESREQRVLVEQEVGKEQFLEHVQLAQIRQLLYALEQEEELGRQGIAGAIAVKALENGLASGFSSRVWPLKCSASLRVNEVLPAPIGPSIAT